jgi:hypothetical protein
MKPAEYTDRESLYYKGVKIGSVAQFGPDDYAAQFIRTQSDTRAEQKPRLL